MRQRAIRFALTNDTYVRIITVSISVERGLDLALTNTNIISLIESHVRFLQPKIPYSIEIEGIITHPSRPLSPLPLCKSLLFSARVINMDLLRYISIHGYDYHATITCTKAVQYLWFLLSITKFSTDLKN